MKKPHEVRIQSSFTHQPQHWSQSLSDAESVEISELLEIDIRARKLDRLGCVENVQRCGVTIDVESLFERILDGGITVIVREWRSDKPQEKGGFAHKHLACAGDAEADVRRWAALSGGVVRLSFGSTQHGHFESALGNARHRRSS